MNICCVSHKDLVLHRLFQCSHNVMSVCKMGKLMAQGAQRERRFKQVFQMYHQKNTHLTRGVKHRHLFHRYWKQRGPGVAGLDFLL